MTKPQKMKLRPEDWEKIVTLSAFGKTHNEIGEAVGVTGSAVSRTLRVFRGVLGENWEDVCAAMKLGTISIDLISWCAEKTGKKIPEETEKAIDDIIKERRAKDAAKSLEKATPEIADQKPAANPASISEEEKLYFIKTLENQAKIIELLETMMDVVIQKYVCDIKDNNNANNDVQCKQLERLEVILEKIAKNTRPRGM